MQYNKNCKIELIASKDATRTVLCNPYLDGNNLVATDGRKLVCLPVQRDEHDTDGPISIEALKLSKKRFDENATIYANGSYRVLTKTGIVQLERIPSVNYPNYKQILTNIKKDEYKTKVCFNAKFLFEIAQSLGTENVIIEIKDNLSPIVVTSNCLKTPEGAIAVLMPVSYDKKGNK